ncbi:peptidase S46 [Aureococcus anophagefferens]|nr:peptidase S46 [Aureococcus anophagefferens]
MAASKIASAMGSRFRTWPIGETAALHGELAALGLKLPAAAIDGTGPDADASALSNALVSVGASGRGGTGSFISKSGLIVTNHHVALDAVRSASRRAGVDYLEDGFVAKRRSDEVATESYECWITRRCEDVSAAVVDAAGAEADPLKRALAFRDAALKTKDREAARRRRCEVKATWPERTYTLFVYERLSDVRLVYVPPRSLGNFGGDVDNLEWPRHTADFALLRAYGADGRPYAPSAHLRTAPGGADAGDFVFLLGFPGRTTRYAPASRLRYAEAVAVPSLCRDFRRKLDLMERALDEDEGRAPPPAPAAAAPRIASYAAAEPRRAVPKMVDLGVTAKTRGKPTYPKKAPPAPAPPAAGGGCRLKIAAARKSLANELKRSSGKRAMLRRVGLVAEREAEEQALVAAAPAARPLLDELARVYARLEATAGAATRWRS